VFFCCFAGHDVAGGAEGKKPISAGCFSGGAWKDAPPLFLRWQKGFPAISGVLGTVL
jgi:hypothetical protein